jgi:hypothetical protein
MLVKPQTVIRWHRKGFRFYWRWNCRERSGRPGVSKEIRDLVRNMSSAKVLWGAPRLHAELLKLGIEVSQATVATVPRPSVPRSPCAPRTRYSRRSSIGNAPYFGQLTVLREPESTTSTAGSATHTNGKVGCRSLFAIDPTVPRWQRNGCRSCPTAG